jgi:hypothetical protein
LDHLQLISVVEKGADDPDVQGALVRYLVVRSAGFVEASRDALAAGHAQEQSSPRVHARVKSGLSTGLGVRPAQLKDFLNTFDPDWATDFAGWSSGEDGRVSGDLGALVDARKKIAHGVGAKVGKEQALRWAATATKVVDWLTLRMDPSKQA